MNRGSIAIVDALGFKGIWGAVENPSTTVLETLKRIGEAATLEAESAARSMAPRNVAPLVRKILKDPFVKVVQLSDTIVVAAGHRPRERTLWKRDAKKLKEQYGLGLADMENMVARHLRELVCSCVCVLMKVAALCEPPLVYRGVVTAGHFAIDETFILGPAVDEAAELMDLAEGAFVWMAPSALRIGAIATDVDDALAKMVTRYRVPLKGGQKIRTLVLNPFAFCTVVNRRKVERNILRRMGDPRIDVVVKRNNTEDFFRVIRTREQIQKRAEEREESKKVSS